jgi:Zn-dependent M28 family amino/carboxypeptidase
MQTKHYPIAILLIIFILGTALYLNSFINAAITTSASGDAKTALSELSAERYLKHVTFLAGDDMKGRGNGSLELERAADYIALQFRISGLKPAGDNGTFFQKFDLTVGSEFGPKNALAINGVAGRLNEDFVPISFSKAADVHAPVVFVGYGISAPELNYDDYAGVDAKDKVVVALRHNPQESDVHSRYALHAELINKAINARQHGASGIIFITDPNNHDGEEDAVGPATKGTEPDDVGIAAVHAKRDTLAPLFAKLGKALGEVQKKIDADLKPQSFDLPDARIHLTTDVIRNRKTVRNVLGAITGTDPQLRNQWVIVGAHYDHLGLGDRHSLAPSQIGQIHHGADDNASGTSGVLEVARMVARTKQLKRSVLFMTFAGEELGLLGSSYFANHITVPLDNVAAMINMDMIGRLQNDRLFVGGIGTSPKFKPAVEDINKQVGLTLDYSDSGFGSSDHTSFAVKHIPVLFLFSGLHSDYHKPSDTFDKINAAGAKKVLTLAYLALDQIANDSDKPQYTEVQQPQPAGGGGSGYGPYFGSIPDFRDDLKGVLFADVRPNSPAAKAGFAAGDLMTEFDGKAIQNLYDFTFALRGKKPGDVVEVVVKRNGQDVKANVTLEARK